MEVQMKFRLLVFLAFLILPTYSLLAQEEVLMALIRERTTLQEQAQTIQSIIILAEENNIAFISLNNNDIEGMTDTIMYVHYYQSHKTGIPFSTYSLAALRAELEHRNNRIQQITTEISLMMQVMQNQSRVQQQGQIFN